MYGRSFGLKVYYGKGSLALILKSLSFWDNVCCN